MLAELTVLQTSDAHSISKATLFLNCLPLVAGCFNKNRSAVIRLHCDGLKQADGACTQFYPSRDETLMWWPSKCQGWSLGLLRCAASSIATGDI